MENNSSFFFIFPLLEEVLRKHNYTGNRCTMEFYTYHTTKIDYVCVLLNQLMTICQKM